MKKLILSVLFTSIATLLCARQITGTVVDKTGNPVAGVSVFYDMTSTYTITDAEGHFSLPHNSRINTDIIFTHVSYLPRTFPYPYDIPDTVVMADKIIVIEDVVVKAEYFTRKEKLEAFRRQFLGTTSAGKSCVIENEDDITLIYDMKENRLYASGNKPLIIRNRRLGYTIRYFLVNFYAEYFVRSIDDADVRRYHINGLSSFYDTNPYSDKVKKRREEIYRRSYTRFWHDIVTGKIKELSDSSEFRIFKDPYSRKPLDPANVFRITDFEEMKLVEIHPDSMVNSPDERWGFFDTAGESPLGQIHVRYKKYIHSNIAFFQSEFVVDEYGNIGGYSGILYNGNMAKQRVGEMMPRDYLLKEPPENPEQEEKPK